LQGLPLRLDIEKTAKHVSSCLQLAILLEVSAHKPGNVNRKADFKGTRYEHFLASAVAAEPSFARAARRGIMAFKGKIESRQIGVGDIIKGAVADVNAWQYGGNTLLGTIILLTPIAVAAGIMLAEEEKFTVSKLRRNIKLVVQSTTPSDAVAVYQAVNLANPSGLDGKAPMLDINDPQSQKTILERNITLHDVFKISAPYDSISREWVENYPITFDVGFPYFARQLENTGDMNTAIVQTFLKVLSEVPDTLIARKVGFDKAKEVSERARDVLDQGGLTTSAGRERLSSFDRELRKHANRYNPGTTADVMAAILAASVLNGYRP